LTRSDCLSMCRLRRELWRRETALVIEVCNAGAAAQLWDDRHNLAACVSRLSLAQRILIVRQGKFLYPAIQVNFSSQSLVYKELKP